MLSTFIKGVGIMIIIVLCATVGGFLLQTVSDLGYRFFGAKGLVGAAFLWAIVLGASAYTVIVHCTGK